MSGKTRWSTNWHWTLWFIPGLLLALLGIIWGGQLRPYTHVIPEWENHWVEPGESAGRFKSWRQQGDLWIGETEPFPFQHPRATSRLRGTKELSGDARVTIALQFARGRYLGCWLCLDPVTRSGYFFCTGHDRGEDPGQASIHKVRANTWTLLARAPLEIIHHQTYIFRFSRQGDTWTFAMDDKTILSATDVEAAMNPEMKKGVIEIELHGSKIILQELTLENPTS